MTSPDIDLPKGAIRSQEVPCMDPECPGLGEPEQDGDLLFYTCTVCGSEFGYERLPEGVLAVGSDGACSMGIPEEIRRAASSAMEKAMGTPIQLGKKPE